MKTWRFVAVAAAFILTACSPVGSAYKRPVVVEPPLTFRGADAETWSVADPASLADSKWFEIFKDSALQQLIRTALAQNHDLRDATVRIEAARANLGITKADQLPTIAAGGDVSTIRSSSSGSFPFPEGFEQRRTFGSVVLNLVSFEADVWGRLRRATEASQAALLASEENRKSVVTTLVSDVAAAYFNLIELDTELEIAKRTLEARRQSEMLIRHRAHAGMATMLDLRQSEQLVYLAQQTIPAIEQQIEQTENRISLLLGQNPGPIPRGSSLIEQEQPVVVPAGLPSDLLERRPDIRTAEQALVATNASIGIAKAAYYPRISLTGLLGSQSGSLAGLFTGGAGIWQFVPQVSQPIFTAGRLEAGEQLAKSQYELAVVQYQRVIQTAFREVSDTLVQYQKVREIRETQEQLVAALQDRSRLSYIRYRGGVDTLLNALDADRDLFEAELALAQSRRNELLTLVQLYRALGGGWQE